MKIDTIKGNHSINDKIILLTTDREKEAITLNDVFKIIRMFTENELNRIRIDKVRFQIINGDRPFIFENKLMTLIEEVKQEELCRLEEEGVIY